MSAPHGAAAFFAENYFDAREHFRTLANALGWQLEAHAIEARGPGDETLTIDVAIGAAQSADAEAPCLVVSSGLHGVEGFLGSALQAATLRYWSINPVDAPYVRVVFVHALNPYGFAWLRRADQANIDLNRNFLRDGEAYAGSPASYAALDRWLNPQRAPHRVDTFLLQALPRIVSMGLPALKRAIAGGQFDFPRGLFYGGNAASETKHIAANNLARWLGGSRHVLHLDLHSGLGKAGSYKLLLDYTPSQAQRERLHAWFGPNAFEENATRADDEQVGYATRGGLGQWCVSAQQERDYLFAYAEFGACNIVRTLAGLRAENQAHFYSQITDAASRRAKARLKDLLCPPALKWRERALAQGVALIRRAASGLARV